jgi:Putative beta-barrel porin-2, OmpL-like. bbp2
MIGKKRAHATLFALCCVVSAIAQTSPDPPAPAPAPPPPTAWKLGGVDVSGMIDGYYSLGFNHPAGHVSGLRNFDDKGNQMELNMAALTLDFG